MTCPQCRKRPHDIKGLCLDCYITSQLPSQVHDTYWVQIGNRFQTSPIEDNYALTLLKALVLGRPAMNPDRKTITVEVEGKTLSIPVTLQELDELALKSGLVVGKWIIYRGRAEINEVWKTIAKSTFNGELGVSAKVSTVMSKSRRHVICVYTGDYLDFNDVMRVRAKLKDLKFTESLCYKPDIYTYLGIYYGTTSLSPCRYRD